MNYPNPNVETEKVKKQYEELMYGVWRNGEKVEYSIEEDGAHILSFFGVKPATGAKKLNVKVSFEGRSTEFSVPVYLPNSKECKMPKGGRPFLICMHELPSQEYALKHGYAIIIMNAYEIASDNYEHKGCFYDIHPYGKDAKDQTGVLMAWSWGCSKILDALIEGAAKEFLLNTDNAIVTGVSRWGKATAVCGLFDTRFKMVVPACSGAGGLALYRFMSEGMTFDFSGKGASPEYTYTKNEPLGSLLADGEKGWFNDRFSEFSDEWDIPLEQYELVTACADKDRYYFIIGALTSEDWVNAPSMWACYLMANSVYEKKGLSDHLVCNFHKEGHAVIEEDMMYIIEFFNEKVYGIKSSADLSVLKTSEFEKEPNSKYFEEIEKIKNKFEED